MMKRVTNVPSFMGTQPSLTPQEGEMYVDTNTNVMHCYFGGRWNVIESTVFTGETWKDELIKTLKQL